MRRPGPARPLAAAISPSFLAIPLGRPRRAGRDLRGRLAALQGEANANISSLQPGCGPGIKFLWSFPEKASDTIPWCGPNLLPGMRVYDKTCKVFFSCDSRDSHVC